MDRFLSQIRVQMVDVNGLISSPKMLECGVPQGSILGPICSAVNDLKSESLCDFFLYADDSDDT